MASEPEKKSVLVVGGSGLVGTLLLDRLGPRAAGTYCGTARPGLHPLDITRAEDVERVVDAFSPDVVIHTAAFTDVNGCELDPDRSRLVNVEGTRHVATAAKRIGARYVFFSTDYVFGHGDGPHALKEATAPLNVYGGHKLEAESLAQDLVPGAVVIRGCNLYGYQADGKNYVMSAVRALEAGQGVKAAIDQWVSPTYAADYADTVERVLALWADTGDPVEGILHVAGPDHVSRHQWALLVCDAFGLDPGLVEAVPVASFSAAATRPIHGGLIVADSEARLGLVFTPLRVGLAKMASAYSNAR